MDFLNKRKDWKGVSNSNQLRFIFLFIKEHFNIVSHYVCIIGRGVAIYRIWLALPFYIMEKAFTSACQQWSMATWPWNSSDISCFLNERKCKKEKEKQRKCMSISNVKVICSSPNHLPWQVLILIPCGWAQFPLQFMCLLLGFAFSQSHHHFSHHHVNELFLSCHREN